MRVRSALVFPISLKLELLGRGSQAGAWEPAQKLELRGLGFPYSRSFPSSSLGTAIPACERIRLHFLARYSRFPVSLKLELLGLGSQAGAWEPAQPIPETTPTSNTWGIRYVSGHIYPGLRRRAAPSGLRWLGNASRPVPAPSILAP